MNTFKPTWLMIKQHNVTGLKYFCKTVNKDPIKYKGSGTVWKRHLKVHGNNVTTTWCQLFTDKEVIQMYATKFSIDHNIATSDEWANLILENGIDGGGNAGLQMSLQQKEGLCDDWLITTPDGTKEYISNMLAYCRQHNLNASAMSAVARGDRSNYKGYKCKKLSSNRKVDYTPKEFVYMSKEERSNQLKDVAVKGGAHHEAIQIEFDGTTYNSIAEAKEATNKSYYLITKYGKRV